MGNADPQGTVTQMTASGLLVAMIVGVLFCTFFVTQHRMHYSIEGVDRYSASSAITSGDSQRRMAFISMGAFFLLLLFRRERMPLEFRGAVYWLLFLYIGWSFLSVVWAEDPRLVARRLVVFAILCISATSLSLNVPLKRVAEIVLWTSVLFLLVGIYSELSAGTLSLFASGHRFSGTYHPESQALNCAALVLASLVVARGQLRWKRNSYLVLTSLGFIFLLMTRSRGPTVGLMMALLVYTFYSSDRSRILTYLYVIFMSLGLAFLMLGDTFAPTVGEGLLLGRTGEEFSTLTGRTPLWVECIEYAKTRPIGGYGFAGFWTGERALDISDSQGWTIHSSHSLFIETVLNLGLVGLGLLLTLVFAAWTSARRGWRYRHEGGMALALSLLTLWMVDGLLSTSISGRGFVTFLALVVFFGVARENSQLEKQRRELIRAPRGLGPRRSVPTGSAGESYRE